MLSVFALTHVSHSILAFQIDISEDDIDDGFRRLFVQLAGEVRSRFFGGRDLTLCWILASSLGYFLYMGLVHLLPQSLG